MKIVLAGGSGQVGTLLARHHSALGNEVVVLSRHACATPWRTVTWDAATLGPWADELDGCDVVVNLAGRSVNCRYTPANRKAILDSRVLSTRVVGEAIARASRPPAVWLQSATATIYSHRYDAPNDEATGILDDDAPGAPDTWRFSVAVAKAWEAACNAAPTPRTRKVLLRTSMVMSPDRGGVFDTLLSLVRRGLGGTLGNGKQYISWMHGRDFVAATDFLIARAEIDGAVNLASPGPLPIANFMRDLRHAAGIRFGLPAPAWMLEIGCFFMQTESELLLKSRRVVPATLLQHGFAFEFPAWPEAAEDLCKTSAAR